MCWSLHLETYRKIPSSFFFIRLATCPTTQECTAQQTLAVAISATFFSKYSVLSLSLSSSSAIPNIASWHHLDKLHFYALSYVWQRVVIYILELWMKCDGNHTNYKGSALPQRNFQVKFPDYMTFWPQREWTIWKAEWYKKRAEKPAEILLYSSLHLSHPMIKQNDIPYKNSILFRDCINTEYLLS